ncbi:hypothetical protein [Acinetobacter sp. ANC 4648]|uniref:hypothetical protein n=1 Tax=Acinetobacter sp. ANC 4648 TaxID=1977875 RepID=UPI000A3591E0|nr:hypothetical protein [Acinetobacter sp. ANC 4648]OTG82931.1 hypothetical protein B9T27_06580 [Acinetobacter sp. ANC 4648]
MLISKDQFLKFKSQFKLEDLLNIVVVLVILSIIFCAVLALKRPIESQKYDKVRLLTEQQQYPSTQKMANYLILQDNIAASDYFRLMWAHYAESSKIKEYPAMAQDDAEQVN